MKGAYKNDIKQLTNLSTFVLTFMIGLDLGILQGHSPVEDPSLSGCQGTKTSKPRQVSHLGKNSPYKCSVNISALT
jgi:hypothetical protein